MASDKQKAMQKVQTAAFALVEANLFLDSHPENSEAIAYYEKYLKLYKEAVADYESKYSPINHRGAVKNGKWAWTTTPWPWERSEN